MNLRRTSVRALVAGTAACALAVGLAPPAYAEAPTPSSQLEALDRGLVAVATEEGVFLSWRLLATEAGPATDTGVSGPSFAVFRDGQRIATVDASTNYADPEGTTSSTYTVAPAWHDITGEQSAPTSVWSEGFYDLPLRKPDDGVTPAGEAYTYAANDASVADVDGDGALEFVIKWDPSNAKDVSQKGYTGPVYIDTYELDGTLLNRIDLGVNIRAGAHYTQFMVYDFDGDGRSETMLKTAPGTTSIQYDAGGAVVAEASITMPAEDVAAGYSHADDYRLSAAGYREHLIEMFQGWSEHPEVVAGTWPATLEEAFGIPIEHEYPLSTESATALADYFITTYAPARSGRNDLTTFEGFILDGPEYLTVFDSATGAELETVRYEPGRGDDGLLWGDYAMSRIEPGNRVDRFLAGVAYLDGVRPSAVFARGYYTRATIAAYDWDGEHLQQRWFVDSGHVPMTNPFNDGPHGRDGTDPEYGTLTTQGFHSLSASDVDGDGKQEIVYGAATIDDDGGLLYSSFDVLPEGSAAPGDNVRLGHGDAMHVTDIDPDRPGLEIWTVHEGGAYAPYGSAMRDAATGEVLFGAYSGRDTGRGMIGDVRADVPGIEVWASMPNGTDGSGLLSATGGALEPSTPGTNQSIRWAADLTTQVVNGSGDATPTIDDWTRGTLLTAEGTRTNNGTKGNPSLVADVLGDWREELVVRTVDSSAVRIYTSTEVTTHKLPTLLHDAQYRAEVARQNTTYNQPSYTSYYLASDMDFANVPVRTEAATPRAPRFIDPRGSLADFVIVVPDRRFDYYVDGEKVRAPLVRVARGEEVTVTAVPKAGISVAAGAESTWTYTFSAGRR
ncbi:rhamnogalacturonan lyase [Microbacterium sp. HD4P20]|uniref:rhamnogalacturonan lyase n=1 Tax=Microbacterium sp. HD4P20 TaxID=2864874 RepID=UPI001C64484A|nr:rhamnogalacturonan lyase [Microbacterium sp. HD4P20]MCP2637162.1 rhamnogalacturonan lyase [Microbacterium sp. HD4P20]